MRYYADLLKTYPLTEDLGNIESRGMQHHRWVEKEAAGVVAAIIAYNYPTQLALAKLAPALAAGCTVVLKGAPDTPLITLALGELIANHTDIPAGVVNVLSGTDPQVGAVLTTSPDVDMVTFTGSTPTGRRDHGRRQRDPARRVFLELGGKSAAIVLDDADFDTAALFSAFSMVTPRRPGLRADVAAAGAAASTTTRSSRMIKNNFGLVRYGDPTDPRTYMGPLISEKQRDKVDGMVKRAVEAGATLGHRRREGDPGYFYTPTLLTDVDPDSEIAQDEVFGPVLVVIAYEDDDDAVRIANNSIYGLSGAVFGGEDRALAVARRIRTGTFSINGGNYFSPDSPFGGYKQSGIGTGDGRRRARGVPGAQDLRDGGRLMSRPLDGIRVLEVAMYGFVPSAGAVLTEWGADVIKVEHAVTGDPQRGLRQTGLLRVEGDPNPNIEHANRGKRSIGLDMSVPEGKEVLLELAKRADVFLTSFLPGHRAEVRYRRRRHPRRQPEDHLRAGQRARTARRGVGQGRLRHDRLLVPRGHRGHHHPARHAGDDRPAGAGLRRHHLRHQPRGRHRRGAAQAGAHRRAVGRRRLTARQRPVGDGPHRGADQAPRPADGGLPARCARVADQPAGRALPRPRTTATSRS